MDTKLHTSSLSFWSSTENVRKLISSLKQLSMATWACHTNQLNSKKIAIMILLLQHDVVSAWHLL